MSFLEESVSSVSEFSEEKQTKNMLLLLTRGKNKTRRTRMSTRTMDRNKPVAPGHQKVSSSLGQETRTRMRTRTRTNDEDEDKDKDKRGDQG